jgi:hypothetical protein
MKRDTETTVQSMHKIAEIKIIATWTDGRTEDLATHMPEPLAEQIEIYCDELEEHRAEVGGDYNWGEVEENIDIDLDGGLSAINEQTKE